MSSSHFSFSEVKESTKEPLDHADFVGAGLVALKALASVASLFMCLISAPSVLRIYRDRDTAEVALLPLVALLVSCHMWCVSNRADRSPFTLLTRRL